MSTDVHDLLCENFTLFPDDHHRRGRLGISRAELLDAITEGVRQAFAEALAAEMDGE